MPTDDPNDTYDLNSTIMLKALATELLALCDYATELRQIRKSHADLLNRINNLQTKSTILTNKFTFDLEVDEDGYADESWESIIRQGQELQAPYRDRSETYWQEKQGNSPSGTGWYGSFEAPKILINCVEPVYRFQNTARLPGSFQLTSPAHMGSVLRFYGTGPLTLKDDNGWWHQTNAPIGLYIEPSTLVDGRHVRNFEQSVSNVTLVAQRGSMPVYISDNAFNFRFHDCNVQSHQGSRIVIKHGPAIDTPDWYPVVQEPSGNNYLPDPVFKDCLIEGTHKFDRRNVGIATSGNNVQFHGLNFYGCLTGIMSTGQGRTVTACSMHDGATGDGRTWASKNQFALGILSRRPNDNPDSLQDNPAFPLLNPIKRTRATEQRGWYQKGEVYI